MRPLIHELEMSNRSSRNPHQFSPPYGTPPPAVYQPQRGGPQTGGRRYSTCVPRHNWEPLANAYPVPSNQEEVIRWDRSLPPSPATLLIGQAPGTSRLTMSKARPVVNKICMMWTKYRADLQLILAHNMLDNTWTGNCPGRLVIH